MSIGQGLRTIFVLALAGIVLPARAAEPAPYPVWWSPELELDSPKGVEARGDFTGEVWTTSCSCPPAARPKVLTGRRISI